MTTLATTLKAADLNRNHLGMTVSVTRGETRITDTLSGISHSADLVEERLLMNEVPTYWLGRIETVLTFANAGSIQLAGDADVTVSNG